MDSCDRGMITNEALKELVRSERPAEREQATRFLVGLLTSADADTRRHGYKFFEEGLKEALFGSCLNYGSLAGGFTDPLIEVVMRTVEFWADPVRHRSG